MKRITVLLVFFIVGLMVEWGSARTLIVSDIDDTLKISHVRDLVDQVYYAPRTQCRFQGMSELYNLLVEEMKEPSIVYLTNAPKRLMEIPHLLFLSYGGFPEGEVHFREQEPADTFKTVRLRALVQQYNPDLVILVGDNGQEDTLHYARIANEFPRTKFVTFIHMVYATNDVVTPGRILEDRQIGFVTPVEIALVLQDMKLLEKSAVIPFVNHTGTSLLAEINPGYYEPQFFPYWMRCQGFEWPSLSRGQLSPVAQGVYDLLKHRCGFN